MKTISSAKIRWDKCSPSILTPLFSQLILFLLRKRNILTDDNDFTSCGKRVERGFRLGREIP